MILVTGGTGFIGSHLLARLAAGDEPVRALVRSASAVDRLRQPPAGKQGAPIEVVRGDLVSGDGIAMAVSGCDTVIHLAGVTKALSSADYYRGNVRATETLARAIAATGKQVRMVHVSSLAAIGPGADATPITENQQPNPLTNYGRSKLEGEQLVRSLLPDAVIIRPPVVYGPRDTDVFRLLKSISQGIVLQMAGGERWFSAIYATDLADGIIAASKAPEARSRDYFMAHRDAVSWSQFAAIAAGILHRKPRVVNVPVPAAYAVAFCAEVWARLTRKPGIISREKIDEAQCRYWVCDTRRAKVEIGFEAATNLNDGLTNTLAWYREDGWIK